jgi:glutamine synthetase
MVAKDRADAKDYILKLAKEQDIKFIRLWFTDILGFLKGFAITFEELESALELGSGFDGSSIQGFARIDESDMVALPDPTTFQILPWRPQEHKTARMFCDICWPGGQPFEGDPRYVLKNNLKIAADMGIHSMSVPNLNISTFRIRSHPNFWIKGAISI